MCQCLVKRGVASARAHKLATPSRKPPEEPEQPEQEDQPPKRHAAFTPARGAAKRWKKQKDTLAAAGAARAAEAEAKGEEQGEEQEEGGTSVKRNKATEATPKRVGVASGSRRGRVGVASTVYSSRVDVTYIRSYMHIYILRTYVLSYVHGRFA